MRWKKLCLKKPMIKLLTKIVFLRTKSLTNNLQTFFDSWSTIDINIRTRSLGKIGEIDEEYMEW